MVILLGLAAAVLYGCGDFIGGTASRKVSVLTVLMLAESAGSVVALAAAALSPGAASLAGLAWGAGAGMAGGLGLILFYTGLATGPMSVVAPVSGLVSTILPVAVALAEGERPGLGVYAGGLLCFVAIVLASSAGGVGGSRPEGGRDRRGRTEPAGRSGAGRTVRALAYGVGAGSLFGLFFLLIRNAGQSGTLWPVASARVGELASVLAAAAVLQLALRRRNRGQRGSEPSATGPGAAAPSATGPSGTGPSGIGPGATGPSGAYGRLLMVAAGAGVIDVIANICYVAASRTGMFGLAVVLASLYPGVTVLLARVVLGERLRGVQQIGLGLAAIGILLVAS
jgi:drug/metabolite transporter (DMT)-like permease